MREGRRNPGAQTYQAASRDLNMHRNALGIGKNHLALANILAATFLTVLNSNMVRVAVPQMHHTFGVSVSWLTWVQNGYALVYAVLMPVTGRLGDMYGRRRMFLIGVGTFTVGSLLCTFTWSFSSLIAFRTLQAIGSSCIFPNAVIMACNLYEPEHRGKVLGIWGSVGSVGAVIGPSLGGFLIQFLDWRSVFYVNIPIGIAVFAAALLQLQEGATSEKQPFDYVGSVLLGTTVLSFLLALNLGSDYGWTSPHIVILLLLGTVQAFLFVRWERRQHPPIVDLKVVSSKPFLVAAFCGMVHMASGQTIGFLMPLFLVSVQGYEPAVMGLMLLPSSLVRIFASPTGGMLSDKYGSRLPVSIGMTAKIVTFYLLAIMTKSSPAWYVWIALLLNGIGGGLVQSPVLNSVLGAHDESERGAISGLFNMTRFIGGMSGTAIAGIMVGDSIPDSSLIPEGPVKGFYHAFLFAAALALLGLALSRMLPDPHSAKRNSMAAS